MKRLTLTLLPALFVALVLGARLDAQQPQTRVGLVDADHLLWLHPAGQAAAQLEELAIAEIGDLERQLRALQSKAAASGLTPEEDELFGVLATSYQSLGARWQAEIEAAAGPAKEAVDTAIRAVAEENGITMVLDIGAAQATGLVVYVQEGLDITEAVVARMGLD